MTAKRLSPLAYRLRQFIQRERLIPRGARVVVAVSGGPDSMALLALLAELRGPERLALWAVYLNHGWRPPAARRELALVRRVGRRLQVPVLTVSLPPRKRPRHSWEGTAREQRYAALARLARRVRAEMVAVGHTQEDQAETVLLALLRGSGMTGAGGMSPGRPLGPSGLRLIRPLLRSRHAELKAYLRGRRLPWAVDATNARLAFRRNRLRRGILPSLVRAFGAPVIERLTTFAELAREEDRWVRDQVTQWCRQHVRRRGGAVRVSTTALRQQPMAVQRRVVRWMVAQTAGGLTGLTFRHVVALLSVLTAGTPGRLDWPHGLTAEVTARAVTVRRRSMARPSQRVAAAQLACPNIPC